MKSLRNADGEPVVSAMIKVIQESSGYLSEIDGAIGDGDHGINMKKGFTLCAERLASNPGGFTDGLKTLGRVLMAEIGGSMGPLYGSFFSNMARAGKDAEWIDAPLFETMLERAVNSVAELGGAKVGDKTLMDTLVPALDAYKSALADGKDFDEALRKMVEAAEAGKESTRDLVAKLGRSARLGDRSKGVLDAGATSCFLLLEAMATSMSTLIEEREVT